MCMHTDQHDYPTTHDVMIYENGNFKKKYEIVGEMNCCCAKQLAIQRARLDGYFGNLDARIAYDEDK